MGDFYEGIIEFSRVSGSDTFIRDEKKVCGALQSALSKVYLDDGDEIELVKKTIASLNSNHSNYFRLESMFIHGNRSQIEFDYYGKKAKKELGDLLVVSTLTRRGIPLLQKLTIIQAKRDTGKPHSWGIDKEQLFFLSNWPVFRGVMGIFPKRELAIPDHSGCLGSYYLYHEPGDFVFVSARVLEEVLGSKRRTNLDELLMKQTLGGRSHSSPLRSIIPSSNIDSEELLYYYREVFRHYLRRGHKHILHPYVGNNTQHILQNVSFCKNINDTIWNSVRLNIGELIFAQESAIPTNGFGYQLLNTVVRYLVRKDQGRLGQLTEFNHDAPFFDDFDLEGISIGVIHTITEVSPG